MNKAYTVSGSSVVQVGLSLVVYKKYVTRKGKKHGPYYYTTIRKNGKIKSIYLGSTLKAAKEKEAKLQVKAKPSSPKFSLKMPTFKLSKDWPLIGFFVFLIIAAIFAFGSTAPTTGLAPIGVPTAERAPSGFEALLSGAETTTIVQPSGALSIGDALRQSIEEVFSIMGTLTQTGWTQITAMAGMPPLGDDPVLQLDGNGEGSGCASPTSFPRYIDNSTILCTGEYNGTVSSQSFAFRINNSNVVFDCNNSVIEGNGSGYGIYLASSLGDQTRAVVASEDDVGKYSSIAVDSNNNLHVSFYNDTSGDLMYANSSDGGTTWSTSKVATSGDVGNFTSIALDSVGNIYISYRNASNDVVCDVSTDGSTWVTYGVYSSNLGASYPGKDTSIAIDSSDSIHIASLFYTTMISNYGLKHSVSADGGATWTTTEVDSNLDCGLYPSIAVDGGDIIHISYYENTQKDLLYANSSDGGSTWTTTSVDATLDSGRYSSIAVGGTGNIYISYYETTGQLMFANSSSNGATWNITSVDSSANVGN